MNITKIERTEREKVLIELFSKELEEKRKEIKKLELLLKLNKKYLKFTDLKLI